MITIDDFKRVELKIGRVLEAGEHPNAERLLVLRVDLGEEAPRQLVAGIKKWYAPESLVGKNVVVAANLQPAVLRGVESNGMVLAASSGDEVILLTVDGEAAPGARVS